MGFKQFLQDAALKSKLELSAQQLDAYDKYYQALISWNEKINLTAITEPQQVAIKHMIDSLTCYDVEFFKGKVKLIDVGTGAGFPGLPLKIYNNEIELTLLDSLNKRLKFLEAVVTEIGLENVNLVHSRAEDGGKNKLLREVFDIAVSRAVARLNVLSELCLPFVKVGGYFIALKGAQYEAELTEASSAIKTLGGEVVKVQPVTLPDLADVRAVIYIKKVQPMAAKYPRKAGQIEKNPLI